MMLDSAMLRQTQVGLPEDHIGFRDGGVRGVEVGDGMGVGFRNGIEKGGGVEDTGIEEIGRLCLNLGQLCLNATNATNARVEHTATGFKDIGAECEDICRET